MPALPFQIITLIANIVIFVFVGYYIVKLRSKEDAISKKETTNDEKYHHVVDDALAKERKIIEDATHEADQIIAGAQQINEASKASLDQALQKMAADMQKQTTETAHYFMTSYSSVLQQLANTSLADFQTVTKGLSGDLQKQINDFREKMLPGLQKELDEYKETRLKETEQTVGRVVQKASQEILNKTLSLEDHHKLMVEALEKAKKAGVFE